MYKIVNSFINNLNIYKLMITQSLVTYRFF